MRRITPQEYEEWLKNDGRGFIVLEEYIKDGIKIKHKCSEGHIWSISPSNIKRGSGCPYCYGNVKQTSQDYHQYLLGDERGFMVLEDYVNANTKIKHQCSNGHIWSVSPHHIKSGKGCPNCDVISRTITLQDYSQYLKDDERGFMVLENYVNSYTKIKHQCKKGHVWAVKPRSVKEGKGCPYCASHGFNPQQSAILYYLSVKLPSGYELKDENGKPMTHVYKIGITNHSVSERYSNEELQDIEVLEEWYFEDGQEAYDLEQVILKSYTYLKYVGIKLLKSGNTELFTKDILNGLQ